MKCKLCGGETNDKDFCVICRKFRPDEVAAIEIKLKMLDKYTEAEKVNTKIKKIAVAHLKREREKTMDKKCIGYKDAAGLLFECGKVLEGVSAHTKRCPECRKIQQAEHVKKWHANKERKKRPYKSARAGTTKVLKSESVAEWASKKRIKPDNGSGDILLKLRSRRVEIEKEMFEIDSAMEIIRKYA